MAVKSFLQILQKRKWLFISVVFVFIFLGAFRFIFSRETYRTNIIVGTYSKFPLINSNLFNSIIQQFNKAYENTELFKKVKKIEVVPNLKINEGNDFFSSEVMITFYDTTKSEKVISSLLNFINNIEFVKGYFSKYKEKLLLSKEILLSQIEKNDSIEKILLNQKNIYPLLFNYRINSTELRSKLVDLEFEINMCKGIDIYLNNNSNQFYISKGNKIAIFIIYCVIGVVLGFITVFIIEKIEI